MAARGLLLVPFVLLAAVGPGFLAVRRLRWHPLEKITGAIVLSLIGLYVLTFGLYVASGGAAPAGAPAALPRAALLAIAAVAAALALAGVPDAARLLRARRLRRTIAAFGLLTAWTLGLQLLIRHYSGADWCCDWLEHYQRTLFFLERWPADYRFLGQYLVTARPPLMNVVAAFFLGAVGRHDFAFYQIVVVLLNVLLYFPCCLIARRLVPRGARVPHLPWLVAIVLAFNPMFIVNATFPWTKVLSACFVIAGTAFYLAGWRKQDTTRLSLAFAALAAGMTVHFAAGPYALFLGVAYLTTILPRQARPLRALAVVTLPAAALLAVWFLWSLRAYGAASSFLGNTSVSYTAAQTAGDNVARILSNTWHTFRPYVFPGGPEDTPLRLAADRAFAFYQENLLGAIGLADAYVVIAILGALLWRRHAVTADARRERWFWLAFVPVTLLVGVAVDGERSDSGVANICLQPLVYLAATLVAARLSSCGRWVRLLVWAGLVVDLACGIALEIYMESRMQAWARTPNWDLKFDHDLVFAGDLLRRSSGLIAALLAVGAVGALVWLARVATAGEPAMLARRD